MDYAKESFQDYAMNKLKLIQNLCGEGKY